MFCNKCGKDNPDKARFCTACGNRLDLQKVEHEATTEQDFEPVKEAGNKQGIIALVIILIVAIAIGGFFLWQAKFKTVEIELSSYIKKSDISFEGFNDEGTAKIDEKAVKKRIQEDYDKGFFEKLQSGRVKTSIKDMKIVLSPDWALSNDDNIGVETEWVKGKPEGTHVKIICPDKGYTVTGLETKKKVKKEVKKDQVEKEEKAENKDYNYIISDSSTRRLTEQDLEGMDKNTLALARNEIYARRGYIFKEEPFKQYFNNMDWYKPVYNQQGDVWNLFSQIEKENVQFIKNHE